MMNKYIWITIGLLCFSQYTLAQNYKIAGKIINEKNRQPIEFATVRLPDNALWAITDLAGQFTINNVPAGKITITVESLGFNKTTLEVNVSEDITNLLVSMAEDNLLLDEVVVTAQQNSNTSATTYLIDRNTLDHAQILNLSEITGLLPGGKSTGDKSLVSADDRLQLHSESGEKGLSSFGTAVEIDGMRLQNNSVFNETKGVDLRSVGISNIESVEIITGIPSVEYGDLSNGMVKINTRKGKTPFTVEFVTRPHTKQIAFSKGFSLGKNGGTLNTNIERASSLSNLASPHTSYDRNTMSINYSNVFNQANNKPLTLNIGLSGNVGGFDSKSDPDQFLDTYVKRRSNNVRGNFRLNWLLNQSWITNAELSGSIYYSDNISKMNDYKSSSSSQAAIHTLEEGYFIATKYEENPSAPIILLPTGYWYQLSFYDSKPISYALKLKADWVRRFGSVTNKVLIGSELNISGNRGRGQYYDDMQLAPTWREYRFDDIPYMKNLSFFAEDKLSVSTSDFSSLQLTAGMRSDVTIISNSEYGTASNFSPRFNSKYIFWENQDRWVRNLSVYAGWGKEVKLPSFEVLYPSPTYTDRLAFAPGTMSDGTTFYAYHTFPTKAIYNPDLKWQHTNQIDFGVEANILGARVHVSAFYSKTYDPYISTSVYTPYSFKLTDQRALENSSIASENRIYTIDQSTGIVTVTDKTGAYESEQLAYTERNGYKSNRKFVNGSPVTRSGLDWIIDFPQIPAIRTSFRLDGSYYYYKGIEETLIADMPNSTITMTDGRPYQYVGYYAGSSSNSLSTNNTIGTSSIAPTPLTASSSAANGSLSRQLNTNLTITTHIPKIRLIFTVKLEASLYNYKRNLSEYNGQARGFAVQSAEELTGTDTNIYGGDRYVVVYPEYYSTWDNPDEKINFAESFLWAKDNDQVLYNDLTKLIVKSNTNYYFNPQKISAYYAANISITKEISNIASISFYATNFINSMARVKSSQTNLESSVYNSTYVPKYYYGLSLRLKL